MTQASSASLEMAIALPLGVVANQLMRIESELRLLNMKALDLGRERGDERITGLIEKRLENINEALDSIRALVSDIEEDIQPRAGGAAGAPAKPTGDERTTSEPGRIVAVWGPTGAPPVPSPSPQVGRAVRIAGATRSARVRRWMPSALW